MPLRCLTLHQIFVSREVLRTARRTQNVWEYTKALFLDYFDPNIAVLCTVSGTNDQRLNDEDMRATLPDEALGVFLGNYMFRSTCYVSINLLLRTDHTWIVAREFFKTNMNDDIDDFKRGLKFCIEGYLERLRRQGHNYEGPTAEEVVEFRAARDLRLSGMWRPQK